MATKCPFCSEKIQKKAVVCKHCKKDIPKVKSAFRLSYEKELAKAKEKEDKNLATLNEDEKKAYLHNKQVKGIVGGFVFLGIGFLFFSWLFSGCSTIFETSSEPAKVDGVTAYSCAKDKVLSELKNPSGADFPSVISGKIDMSNTGDSWTVESYVDAQNGFGATVRTDFSCRLTIPDRYSCGGYCSLY